VQAGIKFFRRWQGPIRNSLLNEGVYLLNIEKISHKKRIARGAISQNGHFSMHPRLNLILGDTYPDSQNILHLYLYDLDRDQRIDVASFDHGVRTQDDNLRCDLHPRWNRSGDHVAVDVCEHGIRQLNIVDVSHAIAAFGE
jgi:hypothetical protein